MHDISTPRKKWSIEQAFDFESNVFALKSSDANERVHGLF